MYSILLWWLGLFAIFCGIGLIILRPFEARIHSTLDLLPAFWVGWAFSIIVLQIWNFWQRVDQRVIIILAFFGAAGYLLNAKRLWGQARNFRPRSALLVSSSLIIVGLWLANRSSGPVRTGDTGLYHWQMVKWITSYPIVPGLGNLHDRFAFNSSYFLYVSMLEVGPWVEKSYFLANGLLMFALLAQILVSVFRLGSRNDYDRLYPFFFALLLGPSISWAYSKFYAGISPDSAVFILGIVLSGLFLSFLDRHRNTKDDNLQVFCLSIVAFIGIVTKLSFAVMGGVAFLLGTSIWLYRAHRNFTGEHKKTILWIVIFGLFIIVPWMIRGVFLSGYLAFPSTLGAVPVPWRVPQERVIDTAYTVRSWARFPGTHWSNVLFKSDWLYYWIKDIPAEITKPLQISLIISLFLISSFDFFKNRDSNNLPWVFLLVPIASILFWFNLAPAARLAGSAFWVLCASLIVLMVEKDIAEYRNKKLAQLLLCIGVFIYISPIKNPVWLLPSPRTEQWSDIPEVEYEQKRNDYGLEYNVPAEGNKCWNVPLPCTPMDMSSISPIESGNIQRGFMVDPSYKRKPPRGIIAAPDFDISLKSGWHGFEEEKGIRWMKTPSRLLIYSGVQAKVSLILKPYEMNAGNKFGEKGALNIYLNDTFITKINVQSNIPTKTILFLNSGFNVIRLELEAGNLAPVDVDPKSDDQRSLSISFYQIEIIHSKE